MKDLHPIDWSQKDYYISDKAMILGGCDSAVQGGS